jgi:oligopeptide/dipeptide ABC transporter ATP-binding protein
MLLSVRDLRSAFFLDEGELWAVDGMSFDVDIGETVGLVGESGCGKTIVAHSILDLIPHPGRVVSGSVMFDGHDLMQASTEEMRKVRGGGIGIVFQEAAAALNPVYRIGVQIGDVLQLHRGMNKQQAGKETVRVLGEMGIPEPEKWARSYPFELSGGMKQRAMIAIAMAGRPKLLIADEPTTALDLTVQAEITELLEHIQEQYRMAILIISHDLEMVAEMSDRLMVMYTGRLVEVGHTRDMLADPRHPYTKGLLGAIPQLGAGSDVPLEGIPGAVPDLLDLPDGCTFHPRCPLAEADCTVEPPPLEIVGYGRECACYKVSVQR